MTCGGIQKESRPITVCHWMSHWTPQLETTLAPRSPHSAARLHASDASATAAVAADERIASVLMLMVPSSLPSGPRSRQHLPRLIQVVDGVQAPADDRVRLPVEVLDPRERCRLLLRVLHVDDHHERGLRVGLELGRDGVEGLEALRVDASYPVDGPGPWSQERRLGPEPRRERLAGRS